MQIPFNPQAKQELPEITELITRIENGCLKCGEGFVATRSWSLSDKDYIEAKLADPLPGDFIGDKRVSLGVSRLYFSPLREIAWDTSVRIRSGLDVLNRQVNYLDLVGKTQISHILARQGVRLEDGEEQLIRENNGQDYFRKTALPAERKNGLLSDLQLSDTDIAIPGDATIEGVVIFGGVECIRVVWEAQESNVQGHALVCPSADYRIVQYHQQFSIVWGEETVTTGYKYDVEQIKPFGDIFIPTVIRVEQSRLKTGSPEKKGVSILQVTEFKPNSQAFESIKMPFVPFFDEANKRSNPNHEGLNPNQEGQELYEEIQKIKQGDFTLFSAPSQDNHLTEK